MDGSQGKHRHGECLAPTSSSVYIGRVSGHLSGALSRWRVGLQSVLTTSRCLLLMSTTLVACGSPMDPGPEVRGRSSVIGQVFEVVAISPIADATVCLFEDTDGCAMTDAAGAFELGNLPDDAEILISIDAPGVVRGLRMVRTGDGTRVDLGPTGLPYVASVNAQRELLAIGHDPGTGYVAFLVVAADALPVTNVRAYLTPAVGDGPYYFNGSREIDPDLTIGTDASGYYYNLPPADYAISATTLDGVPTAVCAAELDGLGWGPDAGGAGLRVPVVADAMTFVVPVCAPPPTTM